MNERVLVVEDNPDLAFGLKNNLEIEGYSVQLEADGQAGLDAALSRQFDLIVLDLMLPRLDGFRVLSGLRKEGCQTPVLILTARGEESDKVRGLRLGADDYVTKPFGVLELLARVEALLRRASSARQTDEASYSFGDITVETSTRTVTRGGGEVALTPREFELLVELLRRDGAVAPRTELMTNVWGYQADVLSRTVDTHIGELRRKLEVDPGSPEYILTVRKVGYRLARDHISNPR